jgi:tetratricopeptide (TPR) repeat protein
MGDAASALADRRQAVALGVEHPLLFNSLAWSYIDHWHTNYAEALDLARRALSLVPTDEVSTYAAVRDTLGWAYYKQGNLPEARTDFRQRLPSYLKMTASYSTSPRLSTRPVRPGRHLRRSSRHAVYRCVS